MIAPVVGDKSMQMHCKGKTIDFLAGKCAFLQTEEDLDVAWERKILIFMQENVHF